jgi:DNA-binding transcriptional MerR regulator
MATHNLRTELDGEVAGSYRIGGVSRLTGVPVTTLRIWESRYGAFQPDKSTGRHRLYGETDVMRARLLRQLSASGHSIGSIARLGLPELQRLLTGTRLAPEAPPAKALSLVVVGEAAAARVNAPAWLVRHLGRGARVLAVHADLYAAEAAQGAQEQTDVLLVRLNALQADTAAQLTRAAAHWRANHTVVLYNFAAGPVLEMLRSAGFILRREPVADEELAEAIRSVTVVDTGGAAPAFQAGATIPRRQFSDAMLAQVAQAPTSIVCECPRHVADLIAQLVAFEEYSAQCLDSSPEDAHLHAYLRSISGSARALFEHALQMVLRQDGVVVDDGVDVEPA